MLRQEVEKYGFAFVRRAVASETTEILKTLLGTAHAQRNLLDVPAIFDLALSPVLMQPVREVIGPACFPVRATFFNKTSQINWKVTWHQDAVVPVMRRVDVPGWGPWSVKDDVPNVRPPQAILESLLAVRVHLDDCSLENGPLKIVPGTHCMGLLPDRTIANLPKPNVVVCTAQAGDLLLMRPLLLHSSSAATNPSSRRVIHIEYSGMELPLPLHWYARTRIDEVVT